MLRDRRVHTTLPTQDLARGRAFWEGALGFEPFEVRETAILYQAGDGSVFALSRASASSNGLHTQMAFTVPDIRAEVEDLTARGVVFDEYDFPMLKTIDGIAEMRGIGRAAWFRDPDDNVIGIVEFA